MRHELTDADVLTLVLEGCNANEIAEYGGLTLLVARERMDRALILHRMVTTNLSAQPQISEAA